MNESKTARYDRDNELAANVIIESPEQHSQFQLDWAERFLRRRAEENGAKGYVCGKLPTVITDIAMEDVR